MPFNIGPGELLVVLIIALVFVLPVFLLFRAGQLSAGTAAAPTTWGAPAEDPRATLADRLAKGEITREEFDTAMRALGYAGEAPRPS